MDLRLDIGGSHKQERGGRGDGELSEPRGRLLRHAKISTSCEDLVCREAAATQEFESATHSAMPETVGRKEHCMPDLLVGDDECDRRIKAVGQRS